MAAAELGEGDPASWVVGVGDSGESPAAFIVVGVDFVFGGFGLGEEAVGVVSFGVAVGFVLQRESAVVFGFDDPVVVRAQQLAVAQARDPAAGAGFDVVDVAFDGGFVAARGVLAVPVT